jgi:4-diphosphocytidyl-2-C-methyl-D-erythritol kinase
MTAKQNKLELWAKKWPAPAKLNLMLRIVGQRTDGYHLLQTVFQFVELCDWIYFSPVEDGRVCLAKTLPGVLEQDDLVIRAALLLKAETGCKSGACIDVEKNLPMGGGIGGGSSDAATTLVVLNQLWELQLSTEKLLELGLKLGADVPVFVHGHAAWAEGVGEKLESLDVPENWIVIIRPDCNINTKEIFLSKDLTRNSKSIKIRDFLAGQNQNDCYEVVSRLYPVVAKAIKDLSQFSTARLTGTGACVFALFTSEEAATSAYKALQPKWQVYLTKGINESPLYSSLKMGKLVS